MENPAAVHRLKIGVPATVEHATGENGGVETGKWVAEVTQVRRLFFFPRSVDATLTLRTGVGFRQSFITLLDALKLRMRAKDQLHPYLSDLMSGYSRFKASAEWEGRGRILHWWISPSTLFALDLVQG